MQGARGVEPGLARHRRSALRAGWILPVPQLFHFVNNALHYVDEACSVHLLSHATGRIGRWGGRVSSGTNWLTVCLVCEFLACYYELPDDIDTKGLPENQKGVE